MATNKELMTRAANLANQMPGLATGVDGLFSEILFGASSCAFINWERLWLIKGWSHDSSERESWCQDESKILIEIYDRYGYDPSESVVRAWLTKTDIAKMIIRIHHHCRRGETC
jgi:hypothetical protein